MQPLDGIKVLDFSTLLPGPLAGLVLAEAGAAVIKVERADYGEEMRHYEPKWGSKSATFSLLNRGKKSLALDLKNAEQVERLRPLIVESDVLIEQFRPGVMARLGLDYDTLKTWNPKLIYCSITGYGQTGPKALRAGHDLNYIGDTGLLDLSMGTNDTPVLPPALIGDLAGGTYPALVNILMALLQRHQTGKGCHLDIAMTDHLFMLVSWALAQGATTGNWPGNGKGLLTGGSPRYQLYPTRDGKMVAAAPLEQKFWEKFCQTIALPSKFARPDAPAPAVIQAVRALIKQENAIEWEAAFTEADCCCTIVKSLEQALENSHFTMRGLFDKKVSNEEGNEVAALPVCLVPQFRNKTTEVKPAPELGDHTDFNY